MANSIDLGGRNAVVTGGAQGIGRALREAAAYDNESGQLLTGSYMDYAMPRADDLPNIKVGNHVTLCTHNPLGSKGVGEVGAIGWRALYSSRASKNSRAVS